MKGLFLYGAKCNKNIWNKVEPYLKNIEMDIVEYPHSILQNATSVKEIAIWVNNHYDIQSYDFLGGHSMGGFVILEMLECYPLKNSKIILMESNPKPSGPYYRNLMSDKNMVKYGEELKQMFENEDKFYNEKLLVSLQGDFDYTKIIMNYDGTVSSIYGDRDNPGYEFRFQELNLEDATIKKMDIKFIKNSCHMPMIENPEELANCLEEIISIK